MIILTVFISIAAYSGGCGTALTIICAVCGGAAAVITMLEAVQLKTKAWLANSLLMLMTGIYILKCTPCDAGPPLRRVHRRFRFALPQSADFHYQNDSLINTEPSVIFVFFQ